MDTKIKREHIIVLIKSTQETAKGLDYSELIKKLPDNVIHDLYSMLCVSRQIRFSDNEIAANITYDIRMYNRGEAKLMRCLKPPFGKRSIYEDLQPNPDYPLYAGDMVSYIGAHKELCFAVIQYSPELAAFVLTKFTDGTFKHRLEPTETVASMDFVFEIGCDKLVKVLAPMTKGHGIRVGENRGGVNYESITPRG